MVDGRRRSQTGDGAQGTIRLYDDRVNILNNTIANNVSTHEGGGIALDDSTNVVVANNTVAHNITTATAMTSTGEPAPAGLSTAGNSFLLQAELDKRYGANTRPLFSKPTLFNNVFTDNRSGSWSLTQGLHGIGQDGDASPINLWDIGLADNLCNGSGNARRCLSPLNNRLDTTANNTPNMIASPTNLIGSRRELRRRHLPRHGQRPALARLPAVRRRRARRSRPPHRPDGQLPPRRRRQQPGRQRHGHRQRPSAVPPAPCRPRRSTSTTRPARTAARFDIGSDERQ